MERIVIRVGIKMAGVPNLCEKGGNAVWSETRQEISKATEVAAKGALLWMTDG